MDKKDILELVEKNIDSGDILIDKIIGFIKNDNIEDFKINTDLSVQIFQGLCAKNEGKTISAYNYLHHISEESGMKKIDGMEKIHVIEDFINNFINTSGQYDDYDKKQAFSITLIDLRDMCNMNNHKNKDYSYLNNDINQKDYIISHEQTNDDLDMVKIFSSKMLREEQLDFIKYDYFAKNICFVSEFKNDIIDILNNCKIIKALEKTINDIKLSNKIDEPIDEPTVNNSAKNSTFKFKP